MRKLPLLLCSLLLLCAFLPGCGQKADESEGQTLFSFDPDAETELVLWNGDRGYEFAITDTEEQQEILTLLNSFQYTATETDNESTDTEGWYYNVKVTQNGVTTSISITDLENGTDEAVFYQISPDSDGNEALLYLSEDSRPLSPILDRLAELTEAEDAKEENN